MPPAETTNRGGAAEAPSDSFLPPFANEENRELDRKVRDLESRLDQTHNALEENSDRISIMKEHLKNVHQEIQYVQTRVDVKRKELSTEEHLKSLAQRELGRLKVEVTRVEKRTLEFRERMLALEGEIQSGQSTMISFKQQQQFGQEELEQWAIAARQKEEDNEALERYSRQDAGKQHELTLAVQKAASEVADLKETLGNEVTSTQSAQMELDRVAEIFRQGHAARLDLVKQWEERLATVTTRDEAIRVVSEQYASKKTDVRRIKGEMNQQTKFYQNEIANNKELETRIEMVDREVARLRENQGHENAKAVEMQDELDLVRNTLRKVADDLDQQKVMNHNLRSEMDRKSNKVEDAKTKLALQQRRLEEELATLSTLEDKSSQLDKMRAAEEARLVEVEREATLLKEKMFKASESLFALRRKERDLIAEILGGQSQYKNLEAKLQQLDSQVLRQQEVLYNADFQIQTMERKVARAGGERSDEEKRILNARIAKLTTELEQVNKEHVLLTTQVKQAEDDLGRARRKQSDLKKMRDDLDAATGALRLECEETSRAVRLANKEKEDKAVAHDMLRVEIARLRQLLSSKADEVFSLENKKIQMQLSMEERRLEVKAHHESLQAEQKMVADDVHRLTLEVKEREQRVRLLETKYTILVKKNKGSSDEGEETSQAYYVIKAAQEREELQREGDALDAEIKRGEKECRALEATLAQMQGVNSAMRDSFRKVDSASSEAERAELRGRLDKAYDKLKFRRNLERTARDDVAQANASLQNLQAEETTLNDQIRAIGARKQEAELASADQREKAERAAARLEKLQRDVRLKLGGGAAAETALQSIELAEMRETNAAILQELKILERENPDAGIAAQLEAAGLSLPSGGSGMASREASRPGSARSAASSQTSQRSVKLNTVRLGL